METFDIIATTLYGLEDVLADEIHALGGEEIEIINRAVIYTGDQSLLYRSNLLLRTAMKVLKPIASFDVEDETMLYNMMQKIKWDKYFSLKQTFAIDATVSGEVFTHSKYVALKSKDAIVDQFRDKYQIRPSIDVDDPDIRINIHITDVDCTVSLDSSGIPLSKRGYRLAQNAAPLSEVLASGIILLTGWDKKSDFLDPMCGSGTIPIEAALIARNIPPGNFRSFIFEKWSDFDADLWSDIKKEAQSQIVDYSGQITGQDIDENAIEISIQNAKRAGVLDMIRFKNISFFDEKSSASQGVIVINPPYGERLKEKEEIIPFYKEMGDQLKKSYNGCDAWILSGNIEAIKFIGLRPSRKIWLFNGPIECKLHKFELYRGTKRKDLD